MEKISFEEALNAIREGKATLDWDWYDDCQPEFLPDGDGWNKGPALKKGDAFAVLCYEKEGETYDLIGAIDGDYTQLGDVAVPADMDEHDCRHELERAAYDMAYLDYGDEFGHYNPDFDYKKLLEEAREEYYPDAKFYLDYMRGFANEWTLYINPTADTIEEHGLEELSDDDAEYYFSKSFLGFEKTDINCTGLVV
ncbi:MAG: hypothetical protein Pg6A_20200 [Termitinemataceae bacterium]|nr:MAG: hypothetical protein Pg6A_20200 [Termitinemataceae bacterium]